MRLVLLLAALVVIGIVFLHPWPGPAKPQPVVTIETHKPIQDKGVLTAVVNHGLRTLPKIALTFDADMTPFMQRKLRTGKVKSYYNQKIIDILEKDNIPATLFLTGLWAKEYPEVSRKLAQSALFEIGNHSYSHPAFSQPCFAGLAAVAEEKKEQEIALSQKTIQDITGVTPKIFRFPGGCFQNSDLEIIQKYGLTVVGWDVDTSDAFNNNKDAIVNNVKRELKPGSILVMHLNGANNAPRTADALPEIIDFARAKNYSFVKVDEMLQDLNTGNYLKP